MEEHSNFQGQSASAFCDIHSLYDIAQAYLAAGRSVVPIAPGSKAPSIIHPMTGAIMPLSWQQYQSQRATDAHIRAWFGAGKLMGLGIVCGPLSGVQVDSVTHALEVLDIDDAEILDQFVEAANW